MLRSIPALLTISLSACHFHHGDHIMVDGVRLRAHHQEVLTLESWAPSGLEIGAHQGDIDVRHDEGPTVLVVTVHEREPGDASATVEQGKLVVRSHSGSPCAIGEVLLRTSGPVPGLSLSTGMGDVTLRQVKVEGYLSVYSGMGDLEIHHAGKPERVELSTGMGDVEARHLQCTRLTASTGMGDVELDGVESTEVELSSGMGDVEVVRSRGDRITAGTGLGDVELVESSFSQSKLDSGLGSVKER
jgi:DUF4097 and DUF4098 domain-containing protein YvlB